MKILVALKDRAIQAYGPVMTVNTRAEAIRSFTTEVKNPQSQIAQHPTDYELWQLATYDDQMGTIESDIELIARAEDFIERK